MSRFKIIAAVVVLALAAAGWTLARSSWASDDQWARVGRRDLAIEVPVAGELRATSSASIGPPSVAEMWDFKISFLAPEGTEVEAGQSVLRFDTSDLERRLDQRVAERDAAEKELEKASTDLDIKHRDTELRRSEALARLRRAELKLAVPEDVASHAELAQARIDKRLADLEVAGQDQGLANLALRRTSELEALRQTRDRRALQVETLQSQIAQMTITAPRAGTVIYLSERGEKPKVGDSVWRGRRLLEIPDLKAMRAEGEVDEADVGRVELGQVVTLRLDSHPDEVYRGRVASMRRAVQTKSPRNPEKVVRIEIALDETDTLRMRPGMRYRGSIEVERISDTLVVPENAVFSEPGGLAVYVPTWNGRRVVRPTFGARNAEFFAVRDGLREGDWVLVRTSAGEGGAPS